MATAANNGFDAERFAALWAGADTGNNNEAEAITKFRAARRMAAGCNLRLVDCMTGRDDVTRALDAQMKPLRKNGANAADLAAARERADKLGAENLDLMRKVQTLAGELTKARETGAENPGLTRKAQELAALLEKEREASRAWARKYEQERQRAARASASQAPPRASAPPSRPVSQSWTAPPPFAPVDWAFLKMLGFIALLILLLIAGVALVDALFRRP
jgi:hypothetical protein